LDTGYNKSIDDDVMSEIASICSMSTSKSERGGAFKFKDLNINFETVKQFPKKYSCGIKLDTIEMSKDYKYSYTQSPTRSSVLYELFDQDLVKSKTFVKDAGMYRYETPSFKPDIIKHLNGFNNGIKINDKIVINKLKEASKALQGKMKVTKFSINNWFTWSELKDIQVGSTHPGIDYRKSGFQTKSDALHHALPKVFFKMKTLQEKGILINRTPCLISNRAKLISTNPLNKKSVSKKGRMVLMPSMTHHLLGTLAFTKFNKLLKKVNVDDGGVMIGISQYHNQWRKFGKLLENDYYMYYVLDFSSFDQRVPSKVLEIALDFIKNQFQSFPNSDIYWKNIKDNLINTLIALPNGMVVRKKSGVASGDPGTSDAGSVGNYLMLFAAFGMIPGIKIFTFGDDAIIAFLRRYSLPSMMEIADKLKEMFGMIVSTKKSYISLRLRMTWDVKGTKYNFDGASFLSKFWNENFISIPDEKRAILSLIYPERNKNNVSWEIMRTVSMYIENFFNPRLRQLLFEYFTYLNWYRNKVFGRRFERKFENVSFYLYELKRRGISFKQKWLETLPSADEIYDLHLSINPALRYIVKYDL
jgi:hypothetical protein